MSQPSALPAWCGSLDQKLRVVHGYLMAGTMAPVVGAIPAALRLLAGLVEAVVGVVFVALSLCLLPCKPELGKEALVWSGKHVLHGAKRALTAPLVAIPFVTCCLAQMSIEHKNRFA